MKGSRLYYALIAALMLGLCFGIFSVQEAYSRSASSHSPGIDNAISCVLSAETPNIYGTQIRAEGRMDCNSDEAVRQVYVDVQLQRLDAKTSQWVKEGEKQGSNSASWHFVEFKTNCPVSGEAQYRSWVTGRYQDAGGWHDVTAAESSHILTCP